MQCGTVNCYGSREHVYNSTIFILYITTGILFLSCVQMHTTIVVSRWSLNRFGLSQRKCFLLLKKRIQYCGMELVVNCIMRSLSMERMGVGCEHAREYEKRFVIEMPPHINVRKKDFNGRVHVFFLFANWMSPY